MNAALKQRLVGATVLVALAVIFLPMLFDGAGTREDIAREVRIPDRPQAPESPAGEVSGAADDPSMSAETDEAPAAVEPDAGPEPAPEAAEEAVDEGEQVPDPPETVDEDAQQSPGWAVQVGSFSREENAQSLRDDLRAEGFDTFIDESRADGSRMWRVRVGPVPAEDEAHALRDRLEQERDMPGLVVGFP